MRRLVQQFRRGLSKQGRRPVAREVKDELSFHIRGRIDELVDAGWTEAEAKTEVMRRFGDYANISRACRRLDAAGRPKTKRDLTLVSLLSDVRHAVRLLTRSPAFAACTVATLALGLGANAAMFSIVNALWQIPTRFEQHEELVFLWTQTPRWSKASASGLDWLDWREQSTAFVEMGAYRSGRRILSEAGAPETIEIVEASGELFPLLGLRAQLGRLIDGDVESAAETPVAVLSDELWQRRFASDPEVLGQVIKLDAVEHVVVGVLEPKVGFDRFWRDVGVFTHLSVGSSEHTREGGGLRPIARLQPGVSVPTAQTEMDGIAERLAGAYPATNADREVLVESLRDFVLPIENKLAMGSMLMAACAVLMIACVNLASFLLARASVRGPELAVRIALGAGHRRIVRQLMTESLVLALLGGGLGLAISRWAVGMFSASWEFGAFRTSELGLNPPVVIYTLLSCTLAALAFGMAPALAASRTSVGAVLRGGQSSNGARTAWRNAIVVGQLALTIPLLVACAMAARQLAFLETIDYGFDTNDVMVMKIDRPEYRYATGEEWSAVMSEMLAALAAVPGLRTVGATLSMPLGAGRNAEYGGTFAAEDETDGVAAMGSIRSFQVVTPGYFETLGVPVVAGRAFTPSDLPDSLPVALVNERMAERSWPQHQAVGQRFTFDRDAADVEWITVVGVVADFGIDFQGQPIDEQIYMPHAQQPSSSMMFVGRVERGTTDLVPTVTAAIQSVDAEVPIYAFSTVEVAIEEWLMETRLFTSMIGGIGLLALGLASIGLFGMISYSVAQRTREIGVRLALGARRVAIVRLVLARVLKLTSIGVAAGAALSAVVAAGMISNIHGTTAPRTATILAVLAILAMVVGLAAYLPARRATRIDPLDALRAE